jgi:hypothetical protein
MISWESRAERFRVNLGFSDSGLFTATALPFVTPRAIVVVCPSLLHDLLRNYRREVLLARRLAYHGIVAVRFHYQATGNSLGGEADDLGFADLVRDARETLGALLSEHEGVPAAVFGARFGALVAMAVASEQPAMPVALWDPVPDGVTWLKGIARDERAAALVDRLSVDPSDTAASDRLGSGERLPSRLLDECETINLAALVGPHPAPVFVAELSIADRKRSTGTAVDALRRVVPDLVVAGFPDEGSWAPGQRTPPRENPLEPWPLLDHTVAWLDHHAVRPKCVT